MSNLNQLDRPSIEPIYQQMSPNESIVIGPIQMSYPDQGGSISGDARLRFTPEDSLEIVVPTIPHNSPIQHLEETWARAHADEVTIDFSDYGTSIKAFLTSASPERVVYHPKQAPVQVRPPSSSISKAIFHLFNWPDFNGPGDYILRTGTAPLQGAIRCGQFIIDVDPWVVTVAATTDTRTLGKSLKETGGYVITHVGLVQRKGGEDFSTKELDDFLVFLLYSFSFVLGRWSGPSLCVGFDASENRVYEQWGLGQCTSGAWNGSQSWFDQRHSELVSTALPGFWRLWLNDVWHRPITEAIYWYTSANLVGARLGVDSALLFTQSALELLSWTYCVLDRKMVSANAFKPRGLSASDKLRLLASSLGIPLSIPACLASLHGKPGKKWNDSMDAITDLRNGLVHPGRDSVISDNVYYDAWRLSMWYLDLILLRLCEYSGAYANRLSERFVGQVEPVPWS